MNKWERIYVERDIQYNGVGCLKNYGTKTRGNQRLMKYASAKEIGALQYATKELRQKYDVIYSFLNNNPHNLQRLMKNFPEFQTENYMLILMAYKNPESFLDLSKDAFKNPRLLKACKTSVRFYIREQKEIAKQKGKSMSEQKIAQLDFCKDMLSANSKLEATQMREKN